MTITISLSIDVPQRPPVQNNFSPRFPLLPGLLSHLRWNKKSVKYWHVLIKFIRFGQGLAPKPAPPSSSYTTSTVTKVSTITSDVTEEIIITFLNRPITTNYVRTTTIVRSINVILDLLLHFSSPQVVTDIHVSRSPVTFGWMSWEPAEKVQKFVALKDQTFL